MDRQYDMLLSHRDYGIVPRHVPGRLRADDFVFFNYCKDLDARRYQVLIEVLDTSGAIYRSIGMLDKQVELPHVKLGWHVKIGVIPDSESLPRFEGELIRGSTYDIPDVSRPGTFALRRHGMWRPN